MPPTAIEALTATNSADSQRITIPTSQSVRTHATPNVKLIRQGDTVVGVEITCSCGQCTRLNFEYGS